MRSVRGNARIEDPWTGPNCGSGSPGSHGESWPRPKSNVGNIAAPCLSGFFPPGGRRAAFHALEGSIIHWRFGRTRTVASERASERGP